MDKTPFTKAIESIKAGDRYDANDVGTKRLLQRIETEGKVARKAVDALLAAGFTVGVNDGEETVLKHSTSVNEIMGALFSTDWDYLYAYDATTKKRVGWVHLVYGNEGHDLVSNYTTNLEDAIAPANVYADQLAEKAA
jgi:hypothetical protein